MKIVGLTRVKNEQDIIESFIRHHATLFDSIVVIDDLSSDKTPIIMKKLQEEGFPLEIRTESDIGTSQAEEVSSLMNYAFSDLHADWIFPLDADEFLEVESRKKLELILENSGQQPLELRWENFCWKEDTPKDPNPVLRLVYRTPRRVFNYKVAIPRSAGTRNNATLFEGNHLLLHHGKPIDSRYDSRLCLAHFPIRSIDQYASKIIHGTARYDMLSLRMENVAYHYKEALERLKTGMDDFAAFTERDSRNFSLAPGEPIDASVEHNPFNYLGGGLRLTPVTSTLVSDLAAFIGQLTTRIASQEKVIKRISNDNDNDNDNGVDDNHTNLVRRSIRAESRATDRALKAEKELKNLQFKSSQPKWLAATLARATRQRVGHIANKIKWGR